MTANGLGPGFEALSPKDMSHGILIAILMHHGGSLDLPVTAFERDALGGRDGSHHAVEMAALDRTTVRLSVVTRPDGPEGDDAILRWEDPR